MIDLPTLAAIYVLMASYEQWQRDEEARRQRKRRRNEPKYGMIEKIPMQVEHIKKFTVGNSIDCFANLRVDQRTFEKLRKILVEAGGLRSEKYIKMEEKIAITLRILGHHTKIRPVAFEFKRSSATVSKCFHETLQVLLDLKDKFLVKPQAVAEDSTSSRWGCFKRCLGALDGTYIPMHVLLDDQTRYRTRKGHIATNVLGVCDTKGRFVHVLAGFEGSAADSRVLKKALLHNDFPVPKGFYYLCDSGYALATGFLTPYRATRYHLEEWSSQPSRQPRDFKEYFNMMHARARNIIERTFGILKQRWAILRSPSFYPVDTQIDIILACALLHNFILLENPSDPLYTESLVDVANQDNSNNNPDEHELIGTVETSIEWTNWRDELAMSMYNSWLSRS